MTNQEIESVLLEIAEEFMQRMLGFRQDRVVAMPVGVVVNQVGEMEIVGITDARFRLEALRDACRRIAGVGVAFVADSHLRLGDSTKPCSACGGPGCETCRGTGHLILTGVEAVTTGVFTKWRFRHRAAQPYRYEGTQLVCLPRPNLNEGTQLDDWDQLWDETTLPVM